MRANYWIWAAATVFSAMIIHILAVLSVPWLSEQTAFARLSSAYPANTLTVEASPEAAAVPFSAPDVLHAYCPFDVSERDLIVVSPLLYSAWSLAVSSKTGENFYVITGADAKKPGIRLLIVPQNRLAQETATEKTEDGEDQSIIVSPSDKGVVTIRAPLRGESFRAQTAKILQRARCQLQKPEEPIVAAAVEEANEAKEGGEQKRKRERRKRR